SRPAAMRRIEVLPQPEGPKSDTKEPTSRCIAVLRRISTGAPVSEPNTLDSISSSSSFSAPAVCIAFQGLHEKVLYNEHNGTQGDRRGEDRDHVEQRKRGTEHKSNPVGSANQLDDKHDLPDDRNAGPKRRGKIRRELRQNDVTDRG